MCSLNSGSGGLDNLKRQGFTGPRQKFFEQRSAEEGVIGSGNSLSGSLNRLCQMKLENRKILESGKVVELENENIVETLHNSF